MTDRELMQQALDSLANRNLADDDSVEGEAMRTLRARLAQPEPKVYSDIDEMFRDMGVPVTEAEPVAWVRWDNEETYWDVRRNPPSDEAVQYLKSIKRPPWVPAYPHPPQREWQGLTDEEIIAMRHMRDWTAGWTDIRYARAIEAKLREKNA